MIQRLFLVLILLVFTQCKKDSKNGESIANSNATSTATAKESAPFLWENANVYFLLTDRFANGDPKNDVNFERTNPTGPLRGFMGGDLKGITEKITSGYFDALGVTALWFTPVVEQIHGSTDEGTGETYGYHGYWTKDWTQIDPNFGTREDLQKLVETAHAHGIRILLDAVINHTGPITAKDPVWPDEWVLTSPTCNFQDYLGTTACTLVPNLPDIRTGSETDVALPDALLAKWKSEGRLSQELDELHFFFERTGYPRAPRYYIIKWLTDYVSELGIDGFRVDTAKHADEQAWADLYNQASFAFESWKKKHADKVLDENPFFMVGEVYGFGISGGRSYNFGDKQVDYFDYGFHSLINFELKYDATQPYEFIFDKYNNLLQKTFKGKSVLNYLSSHDDGGPFDPERKNPYRAANVLLLTPGASQIYYGDESSRILVAQGAVGDANLRTFMNWDAIDSIEENQKVLTHWQKLGAFRKAHPAVGAGKHKMLSANPYVFSRTYITDSHRDKIVVGLDLSSGKKSITVKGYFGNGTKLLDRYSGTTTVVRNGKALYDTPFDIVLLEPIPE
jgi:alpha-amylase